MDLVSLMGVVSVVVWFCGLGIGVYIGYWLRTKDD